jgi:integrase
MLYGGGYRGSEPIRAREFRKFASFCLKMFARSKISGASSSCLKQASLKTAGSERVVPLHPALIKSGLLEFVEEAKSGPLFEDLSPDKFGKRGGNGTKMIGRFVRDLGLKDPRLSPSHSWRHRIKTLGRKYGLAPDLMNAITGHQPETVGDSYGHYPVDALFRELCKIPSLE